MSAQDTPVTTLATPSVATPVARGPGGKFAPKGKAGGKKAADDGKEKAIDGELARNRNRPKRTEGLADHATPPVELVAGEAPKGGGGGKGGPVARGPGGKFAPGSGGKSKSRGSAKRRADRAKRRAENSEKNVSDRRKAKFLAPPGQLREDAGDTELTPDPTTPMEAAPDLMRASEPTIPLAVAPVRFLAPPLPPFIPTPRPAGPVTAMVAPRVGVITGR